MANVRTQLSMFWDNTSFYFDNAYFMNVLCIKPVWGEGDMYVCVWGRGVYMHMPKSRKDNAEWEAWFMF